MVASHYQPFNRNQYSLPSNLTTEQLNHIESRHHRFNWSHLKCIVPELMNPLIDLSEFSEISSSYLVKPAIAAIMKQVYETKTPYWLWTESQWLQVLNIRAGSRPYLVAVAWHMGEFRNLELIVTFKQRMFYAKAIFGNKIFNQELERLFQILRSLGYMAQNLETNLTNVLSALMLENRDPRLETFSKELLIRNQSHRNNAVARQISKVSHGLASMGIIETPLRMRSYIEWKHKSTNGIELQWVYWCQRWRETSTLRPKTRESNYSFILRTGLWLTKNHPQIKNPHEWDMSICADFISAVDKMNVSDWVLDSSKEYNPKRKGLPIAANSKRSFLHAMRRFFIDFELWGWGKLRFSPRHHLATPRTIAFNSGINPRAIDDTVWLKLIWASLNLEKTDMLSDTHYPFEMIKSIAVIWTHAGLRKNEIRRLALGCIHPQDHEIKNENNCVIKAGTICYLDVPASKTFKAFVKPVSVVVKKNVDEWLKKRPKNQTALLDERTGEKVNYLFQFRGKLIGNSVINDTIIPMLCNKVGINLEDTKGRITSHRGRASAVTSLANSSYGMSLYELMQWSGHSSPKSTLNYIRIRPTKLAASFVKADQISHMVSVLIDHDISSLEAGNPKVFYDLGDSCCSNPFWSSCPHRMACPGCDFNLPKISSKFQFIEAKTSIKRYLEVIPLTDEEREIAEGDIDKLNNLINKLESVPTPDQNT